MKTLTTFSVACLAVTLFSPNSPAWDFSYGYQTVLDPNADLYVVGTQNIRKYTEWQESPVTYWGPSANDAPAVLTSHFQFSAPTAQLHLKSVLTAVNWSWRGDYGSASLWGSTDGTSWQLLLDNPVPQTSGDPVGVAKIYDQDVPGTLLGSTSFWVQVRLLEHNALTETYDPRATWADAQFSRVEPPAGGNVFQVDAMLVPEPGALRLGVLAAIVVAGRRLKRSSPLLESR